MKAYTLYEGQIGENIESLFNQLKKQVDEGTEAVYLKCNGAIVKITKHMDYDAFYDLYSLQLQRDSVMERFKKNELMDKYDIAKKIVINC